MWHIMQTEKMVHYNMMSYRHGFGEISRISRNPKEKHRLALVVQYRYSFIIQELVSQLFPFRRSGDKAAITRALKNPYRLNLFTKISAGRIRVYWLPHRVLKFFFFMEKKLPKWVQAVGFNAIPSHYLSWLQVFGTFYVCWFWSQIKHKGKLSNIWCQDKLCDGTFTTSSSSQVILWWLVWYQW